MFKVNRALLPIKAHFFFFFAAMGPLLPQMNVYGRQLGFSAFIMGFVTSVLPILWALAKPAVGFLVDYFHTYRKLIFMSLIFLMSGSYFCIYFLPEPAHFERSSNVTPLVDFKNHDEWITIKFCDDPIFCSNVTNLLKASCGWICKSQQYPFHNEHENKEWNFWIDGDELHTGMEQLKTIYHNVSKASPSCDDFNMRNYTNNVDFHGDTKCVFKEGCKFLSCAIIDKEINLTMASDNVDYFDEDYNVYTTITFWGFVIFMCMGTVAYNVANCIGDAVCLDILGPENGMKYGFQRAWGTAGYGLTALFSGLVVDYISGDNQRKDFTPAFILMAVFTIVDLYFCRKLKLPRMSRPVNAGGKLIKLFKQPPIFIFALFAVIVGTFDSFLIYYMFWFVEDVAAKSNNYANIKFLEGLTIAVESFGGEILFFAFSGKILKSIGFRNTLTVGLFCYAIRLLSISMIAQPWHLVIVEMLFQGPSYALCYSAIVGYAARVAPEGLSATIQGILAGMDDGVGFVFGSLIGGMLYGTYGGRVAFRIMGVIACIVSIIHIILSLTISEGKIESFEKVNDEKANKETIELKERSLSPDTICKTDDVIEFIDSDVENVKNEINESALLRYDI